MIEFRMTISGTTTLIMHNSRLADPLDPATKALKKLTSKRAKTDEDLMEVARIEHAGGLYLDSEIGPYLPADNIWRCLYDAGKKHKLGVKVKEGVVISQDINPLAYKGPRDVNGLWDDENFRHRASVKVGMQRVMRCRPQFREWRTETTGILDPNVMDFAELEMIAQTAGLVIGLGDWRPRYGRFTATLQAAA